MSQPTDPNVISKTFMDKDIQLNENLYTTPIESLSNVNVEQNLLNISDNGVVNKSKRNSSKVENIGDQMFKQAKRSISTLVNINNLNFLLSIMQENKFISKFDPICIQLDTSNCNVKNVSEIDQTTLYNQLSIKLRIQIDDNKSAFMQVDQDSNAQIPKVHYFAAPRANDFICRVIERDRKELWELKPDVDTNIPVWFKQWELLQSMLIALFIAVKFSIQSEFIKHICNNMVEIVNKST